jgi:hypothetical protein
VFVPSQDGWKPSPHRLRRLRGGQISVNGDHPSVWILVSIGLDNGPAFVAEVVQLVGKGLGITWKLHTAYHPQSSGKVEHMNRTLKLQLGKLCQETHLQWDQ